MHFNDQAISADGQRSAACLRDQVAASCAV
jgi:hypothetical protein